MPGARSIEELWEKAEFIRITPAGQKDLARTMSARCEALQEVTVVPSCQLRNAFKNDDCRNY